MNGDAASNIVGVTIGDPCGIGPEVVIKALSGGPVPGKLVLIGDERVVRHAIALTGAPLSVRVVDSIARARFEPGCIDLIDDGMLEPGDVTPGQVSAACGRATVRWWDTATGLADANKLAAIVKAPINSQAQRLGAGKDVPTSQSGKTHLFLVTGLLRVVHLTDHLTLRAMLDQVKMQNVLDLIRLTDLSLKRWGIERPRIGVAGLNPHCYGPEDESEIAPAVKQALAEGICALGPVSPDSVFRQCLEGQYDCVLAHYHDQGHIAVKTSHFSGNCALLLGHPYIYASVAHGTAFDIAGKGIADHMAMASALKTAAMLADGKGFPAQ